MPGVKKILAYAGCGVLLLGVCGLSFAEEAEPDPQGTVIRIQIEGNEKTKERVIKQELVIKEGEAFDAGIVELSRQNIMDLGLFRSVEASTTSTLEGVEVTFVVDEKRFWYLVPTFSRGSDGDVSWGGRLQMDNLFGINNILTVRAKRKDYKDTDFQTEQTFEIDYRYPRILQSDYDLGFQFDYDEVDISEQRGIFAGDYLRERISVGFNVSKWLTTKGPSKGHRMTLGLRSDDYDHEFLQGDPDLFFDTTVNSLIGGIQYINVVDHGAYRSGSHYGLNVELAASILGSEVNHTSYNLFHRRYRPMNAAKMSNLNTQLRFGHITDSIFGDATYSVTGGTAIRGYARDSIEGDTFYIVNIEYLRPIMGRETLRWVGFIDAGNAFLDLGDIDISDPRVGVGAGLRWKIRSFVRTDLRLDVAQGLGDAGDTRVYAGTRATF
ncbi:MAG: BamA/TamA family outer membrane protein [Arenicellales bacterium]